MDRKNTKPSTALYWVGGLLLLLAMLFAVASKSANKKLREVEAALEADGRPLNLEAIVPAKIPDEHNAAIELDSAVQQLKEETAGESDLFSDLVKAAEQLLGDDPNPEALAEFRRLYESGAVAEALALLEDGMLKEGYRSDLDLSLGIDLELPHIHDQMGLAKILAATVKLQAADGNQTAAWETALTSLRLANVLEEEPILISQLVRNANIRMALESIRSLDHSAAPPAHLSEIDGLLANLVDPTPFVAAIDMERFFGAQIFQYSSSEFSQLTGSQADLGTKILMGAQQVIPPLRQMDQAEHSNAMREFAAALAQPYSPSDLNLPKELHSDIAPYLVVSKMITPALGGIKSSMTNMFAEVNVTRAGLAALEYQQQHGTYPSDLASLGRKDLLDPFTNEPLQYRADDTGFTIYSVGSDLIDDAVGSPLGDQNEINWQHRDP